MDGTTINNPNKHFNFNSKHMCTIILINYNECALTMCVLFCTTSNLKNIYIYFFLWINKQRYKGNRRLFLGSNIRF